MISAFLASFLGVFLAEIGDKTQILALFLAVRFAQKNAIILGMLFATLLNHFVSAWLGIFLSGYISTDFLAWIVGISFILVGLWLLVPDKASDESSKWLKYGAFWATFILFFLAEMGDKTQIATTFFAAKYNSMFMVVIGSSLGLLLANIPVVYFGDRLLKFIPMKSIRIAACLLFCILGLLSLPISFG